MTAEQWCLVLAGYSAVSTLGLVVLGSLLDRARNDLRDLKASQGALASTSKRPEPKDFDRLHKIGGGR